MDQTVLPDLKREPVEAERLDLPAQVLQRAVGDPLQSIGDERIAELVDLREQLTRVAVARVRRPGVANDQPPARGFESSAHEAEALSVWLVGKTRTAVGGRPPPHPPHRRAA